MSGAAPLTFPTEEQMSDIERSVIACLWNGDETVPDYSRAKYDLAYVERLARGVKRCIPGGHLTLLVDQFYARRIPQELELLLSLRELEGLGVGGWSNLCESWAPDLWPKKGERALFVGLDTIFVSDCSWLFEWKKSPVGLPHDPYEKPLPCDAVVSYDREGAALIWNEFLHSRGDRMANHLYAGRPSEMALLRNLSKKYGWEPLEEVSSQLLSYKADVIARGVRWQKSSLVYFHGTPKPADLEEHELLKKVWQNAG